MTTEAIDPRRIEELHLLCTEPREQLVYDGWLVRRAPNDIKRARSVNTFAASTLPLADKIDHCERLYADAGLPSLFRITPWSPSTLDGELAARGYTILDHTLQMATAIRHTQVLSPRGVAFKFLPLQEWLPLASQLRSQAPLARDAEARRLEYSSLALCFLIAQAAHEPIACGLVARDGRFAAPADIFVAESWRNRGLGPALTGALLELAHDEGAEIGWLNVLADNAPAIRAYNKLGFQTLYEYWYRVKLVSG